MLRVLLSACWLTSELGMGSTDSLTVAVNQVAKPRVRNVVAVNPCRGLHIWSQQLHGATTPVLEDPFRSTTNTHSAHSYRSTTNTYSEQYSEQCGEQCGEQCCEQCGEQYSEQYDEQCSEQCSEQYSEQYRSTSRYHHHDTTNKNVMI